MKFLNHVLALSLALGATALATPALAANPGDWPFPETPKNPAPPAQPVDVGSCKIITDGLIVIPGNSKDPKNTSHFGKSAKLQSLLASGTLFLRLELNGTNTFDKPNTQIFDLSLGMSIGSDYMSFSYNSPNETDELRWIRAELEFTKRNAQDVATNAILSTLVQQTAPDARTGKMINRSYTARFLCDLIPQ